MILLPPLLGLPWERPRNGDGLGVLEPFAVTGSPLTKVVGQPVLVRWGVRNSGDSSGLFEMNLGAPAFVRSGPLVVNAGADTPVSLAWATGAVAPGPYTVTIQVNELTAQGVFAGNLAADSFSITISAPAPAPAPGPFDVGQWVNLTIGGATKFLIRSPSWDLVVYSEIGQDVQWGYFQQSSGPTMPRPVPLGAGTPVGSGFSVGNWVRHGNLDAVIIGGWAGGARLAHAEPWGQAFQSWLIPAGPPPWVSHVTL